MRVKGELAIRHLSSVMVYSEPVQRIVCGRDRLRVGRNMNSGSFGVRWRLFRRRATEFCKYDSRVMRLLIGRCGVIVAKLLKRFGKSDSALRLAMYLHRNALCASADEYAESFINELIELRDSFRERYVLESTVHEKVRRFMDSPEKLLGTRLLVLRECKDSEKGLIALDYSFSFRVFAAKFNVSEVMRKYHMVLEPSWSGLCDEDVLALSTYGDVFVQTNEARDVEFLKSVRLPIIPINIAANWWIDTRIFRPLPNRHRDAHVLVNASWAKFKRHDFVFSALSKLRRSGVELKTILVGYPNGLEVADIRALARDYGLEGQVELYENISPTKINELLNRVHVNLVWSRREGSNRAIAEGLAAGVPGILRAGFNYGFDYPFVRDGLVSVADERSLPSELRRACALSGNLEPRAWIDSNMNPQIATEMIDAAVSRQCSVIGERWTAGQIAVKVSALNCMEYWNKSERLRFEKDYEFLRNQMRM